ncbi:MAG: cell division protein FtsL [Cycloclasticus sp.]|nr:MAG: cell division protein FtsL [Cycloclasticus sp.]
MQAHGLSSWVSILAILVVSSALTMVYVKYDARLKFNQLQGEFSEQDRLGVEWSRLQLEQNTWSSSNRIEEIARSVLQLQAPTAEQIIYVKVK